MYRHCVMMDKPRPIEKLIQGTTSGSQLVFGKTVYGMLYMGVMEGTL